MVTTFIERIAPRPSEIDADTPLQIARNLLKWRNSEKPRLDKIHAYLRGEQRHPVVPEGSPSEVRRLADISRVNMMDIVISMTAQSKYVDGYRTPSGDDAEAWAVWEGNRMSARQTGIHRAALAYGASYVTVLPGEPVPVIKGFTPRRMTAVYAEDDDDWPLWALRAEPNGSGWMLRLYDSESVHIIESERDVGGQPDADGLVYLERRDHNIGVTPVVRFLNTVDLDEDNVGEIEPLMDLQDQVDITTFSLLVSQWYQSFKQRWIIGWTSKSEEELLKAAAHRVWTFDDSPDEVKVGEFSQADLSGYIESREASLRHAATLSQTPVHELTGTLVNLSAEALVAAEAGQRRKVTERQMVMGEAHEQMLSLAGRIAGFDVPMDAQVKWRDTESRAFAATIDGLTKLHQIGVPIELIIEQIPGFTQQDRERALQILQQGSPIDQMLMELERQAREAA